MFKKSMYILQAAKCSYRSAFGGELIVALLAEVGPLLLCGEQSAHPSHYRVERSAFHSRHGVQYIRNERYCRDLCEFEYSRSLRTSRFRRSVCPRVRRTPRASFRPPRTPSKNLYTKEKSSRTGDSNYKL